MRNKKSRDYTTVSYVMRVTVPWNASNPKTCIFRRSKKYIVSFNANLKKRILGICVSNLNFVTNTLIKKFPTHRPLFTPLKPSSANSALQKYFSDFICICGILNKFALLQCLHLILNSKSFLIFISTVYGGFFL
jgi:hypothetical protein